MYVSWPLEKLTNVNNYPRNTYPPGYTFLINYSPEKTVQRLCEFCDIDNIVIASQADVVIAVKSLTILGPLLATRKTLFQT